MVRVDSQARKDGTTKVSYSNNRHKAKECSLLKRLAIGIKGSGKEIYRMAKVRKLGLNQDICQFTMENMWQAKSMDEVNTKLMIGSMKDSFLTTI